MRTVCIMIGAAALLAGCAQKKELAITDAWVRLSAVPKNPAAGYFTLNGGPADVTLVSVTSPLAIRAEMHEDMKGMRGMAEMRPLPQIPVPAEGTLTFAPGKRHVMLYDVNPAVKAGGTIPLVFTFAIGDRVEVRAKVVGPADPAPKP